MNNQLKFSLIIGTLNRPEILSICLKKFSDQIYKNFEIIIIDQSDNDDSMNVVEEYKNLDIHYQKVTFKGLSKARNEALKLMSGDYFCLIDDDADYSIDFLNKAAEIVLDNKNKIVSGFIMDTHTQKGIVDYSQIKHCNGLGLRETIRLCPSAGLIFPASVLKKVGFFDEKFGVGAKFGAAEETDFLLRCRKAGYKVVHKDVLYIEHPIIVDSQTQTNPISESKVKNYAMGGGALYKKHLYYGKEYELIPVFIEQISKLLVKRFIKRNSFYKAEYSGFMAGWKEYRY